MMTSLTFVIIHLFSFITRNGANINEKTSSTGAILSFPYIVDGDLYNVTWEVEPASFGFADSDGILEAYLALPKNRSYHSECGDGEPSDSNSNNYVSQIERYQGSGALWILVIDRGDCYFATQIYNAETLGASGVIMLDYKYEGFITMSEPDNFGYDITIPSVMLKRVYGEQLMDHLGVKNWDPTNIDSTTYPEQTIVFTKARIEGDYHMMTIKLNGKCGQAQMMI